MNKALIGLIMIAFIAFVGTASAAVPITANVGNEGPTVGEIQVCDGTCALAKTVDPATQFTVKVTVTDPNGQTDINTANFLLEFYKAADSNGSAASWDHIVLAATATGTRDGCTQSGTTYCLQVDTTDWTSKFLAGAGAKVYVRAQDLGGLQDSNTVAALTVNASVSHSEDATSGTYTAVPNSTENAVVTSEALAYIITTHNGNVDMDLKVTATALTKDLDEIAVGNHKWYLTNNYGSSTPFTGAADVVKASFGRGTDPTSATQNVYLWLDVPAATPSGAYTGTLTYSSSAS